MEDEVASLSCLTDKEKAAVQGRSLWPSFVQTNPLDGGVAGPRKTTAISRAWRRTANLLGDILHSKKLVECEIARRKILQYMHLAPRQSDAIAHQIHSFKAFQDW